MEETEGKKITIDLSRGGDTTERVENERCQSNHIWHNNTKWNMNESMLAVTHYLTLWRLLLPFQTNSNVGYFYSSAAQRTKTEESGINMSLFVTWNVYNLSKVTARSYLYIYSKVL